MFSYMYLCYNQEEIAWGHLIFAARVLQCTHILFEEDGTPLWITDRVVLERNRVESMSFPSCLSVPLCVANVAYSSLHSTRLVGMKLMAIPFYSGYPCI
jgi:hypothetical protein